MADSVSTQVISESAVHYEAKFTNISDGTGESAVVQVDVSALTPACAEADILWMAYSTDGMAVRVLFDADTDTVGWLIPANQTGMIDFQKTFKGALRNNSSTGKTGDVRFTTVGHTSGDTYSIILHCKKRVTAEI